MAACILSRDGLHFEKWPPAFSKWPPAFSKWPPAFCQEMACISIIDAQHFVERNVSLRQEMPNARRGVCCRTLFECPDFYHDWREQTNFTNVFRSI
jgi:hypothetical protein